MKAIDLYVAHIYAAGYAAWLADGQRDLPPSHAGVAGDAQLLADAVCERSGHDLEENEHTGPGCVRCNKSLADLAADR